MGKILNEARGEVEKCASACEFYAEHGEMFFQEEIISSDAKKSKIIFQPIGAVLHKFKLMLALALHRT